MRFPGEKQESPLPEIPQSGIMFTEKAETFFPFHPSDRIGDRKRPA